MCGRVYMAPANPELREIVKEMNRSRMADAFRKEPDQYLRAEGEIRPSEVVPVLAMNKKQEQRIFPMKWGFSQKNRLLINARAETAAVKTTFREAWFRHRCIIPVSWYFEWDHDENKHPKQKYALKQEQSGLIWLAGLYRIEEGLPAFVILTRPAEDNLLWMHDRMPVMLPYDTILDWIRADTNPEALIHQCVKNVVWQKAN